jgi:hypothetical protein
MSWFNAHIWVGTPEFIGDHPTILWKCERCSMWTKSDWKPSDYSRANNGMSCDEVIVHNVMET